MEPLAFVIVQNCDTSLSIDLISHHTEEWGRGEVCVLKSFARFNKLTSYSTGDPRGLSWSLRGCKGRSTRHPCRRRVLRQEAELLLMLSVKLRKTCPVSAKHQSFFRWNNNRNRSFHFPLLRWPKYKNSWHVDLDRSYLHQKLPDAKSRLPTGS